MTYLDPMIQKDIDDMSEEEIERIRTAVVIKTYSSLISKHRHRTPEQMAIQLRAVRKFGAALYKNICGPNRYRSVANGVKGSRTDEVSPAEP